MTLVQTLPFAPAPCPDPLVSASAAPLNGAALCTNWHTLSQPRQRLLSIKELAYELRRHRNYISEMKRAGFAMPGNQTTVNEANSWIAQNPRWRSRLPKRRKKRQMNSSEGPKSV